MLDQIAQAIECQDYPTAAELIEEMGRVVRG